MELVLILVPILLVLLVATAGCGRLFTARANLGGVTRDAARVAVTATSGPESVRLGTEQADRTAAGYGMDPARLTVTIDPAGFERGGTLEVVATYQVSFADLPLLGVIPIGLTVSDRYVELIDPHRSR